MEYWYVCGLALLLAFVKAQLMVPIAFVCYESEEDVSSGELNFELSLQAQ